MLRASGGLSSADLAAAFASPPTIGNVTSATGFFSLMAANKVSIGQQFVLGSQIYTTTQTLADTAPYRSIANSAGAITLTAPTSPTADSTRVFTNVGAGTLTVAYPGRGNPSATKTIAQDNSVTMAFNSTLGYWTIE